MPFRLMEHYKVTFSWLSGQSVCSCDWIWDQKRMFCSLMWSLRQQIFSLLKKIKFNKLGSFSILWLISRENASHSELLGWVFLCKIQIFLRKQLKIIIMEDPQTDYLEISTSFEGQRIDFLGDSLSSSLKLWMLLGVLTKHGWPLRPLFATLAVFGNLATQRSIVRLLGTLFLPKYLMYCLFIKSTSNFMAK